MTGIFPNSGVAASEATNSIPNPDVTVGCTPRWYSTQRCSPRFDPAAANAIIAEIINAVNCNGGATPNGLNYDCTRLDNLCLVLTAMTNARAVADTQLQTNINNEAAVRSAADVQLQANINALQTFLQSRMHVLYGYTNSLLRPPLIGIPAGTVRQYTENFFIPNSSPVSIPVLIDCTAHEAIRVPLLGAQFETDWYIYDAINGTGNIVGLKHTNPDYIPGGGGYIQVDSVQGQYGTVVIPPGGRNVSFAWDTASAGGSPNGEIRNAQGSCKWFGAYGFGQN